MRQRYFAGFAMPAAGMAILIAGLYPSGCTTLPDAAEFMGVCAKSTLDDANPCTIDECDPSNVSHALHTEMANGTPCSLGANEGICESGVCKLICVEARSDCLCGVPSDCGQDTECSKWECSAGKCSLITLEPETQIADDDNDCTDDFCQGGQPVHPLKADKTACSSDTMPSGVCQSGTCVECIVGDDAICGAENRCFVNNGTAQCSHCNNGVMDVDDGELGVDCGGACSLCPLGTACDAARAAECVNGFCVDGVCCEIACSGQCRVCTAVGTCGDVAKGMDDATKPCPQGSVCGPAGSGECLKKAGEPCSDNTQCLNNSCILMFCTDP